jgi:GNAT superfamily N-acetyltransferase
VAEVTDRLIAVVATRAAVVGCRSIPKRLHPGPDDPVDQLPVRLGPLNVCFMSGGFQIRRATVADVDPISWHRARMFKDMGELPPDLFGSFRVRSRDALRQMFERENYLGWLASPENEPERIVAGAGVQLREVPPHPQTNPNGKIDIVSGRQAIIQNVFTEPEWRRRGLAALLIKRIIDWIRQEGIDSLVLHASDEGRALYERLGFIATTEMRFNGF